MNTPSDNLYNIPEEGGVITDPRNTASSLLPEIIGQRNENAGF